MDVIIVCHTEFGYVKDKIVVFDKNPRGVEEGVPNLIRVADKYGAQITFAVCPEVVNCLPKGIKHEIGLHVHPGWVESGHKGFKWHIGDLYLRQYCELSLNSALLRDYPYEEQLILIKTGKEYLERKLGIEPKVFLAGKWSENNDTIKALIAAGFTHDCSPVPHAKLPHFDWSKLPRICMPYHPAEEDYQKEGSLPLLIVPTSQMFPRGEANPEFIPMSGLAWLKACFREYYWQNLPLFHIPVHSPAMTDNYLISAMDNFLGFISKHRNIEFKSASQVVRYAKVKPKTNILPYLAAINPVILKAFFRIMILRS